MWGVNSGKNVSEGFVIDAKWCVKAGSDIRCEGCNVFWVSGEVCLLFMYILWYRLHSATRVLSTSASFCLPYLVCTMFLSHLTSSVHILYVFTFLLYLSALLLICIIYRMVGRSIADVSDSRCHIHWGTKRRGNYAVEVGYRGYGLTYHTIYDISYCECATDEPFCVRCPNVFKMTPFFTRWLIGHITNFVAICNFLWLHNHHTI